MRSASPSPPIANHPRHLMAALASAGLVLALHGWLLTGLRPPVPARGPGEGLVGQRTVQVRQILAAVPPVAAHPVEQPLQLFRQPPMPSPRPAPATGPAAAPYPAKPTPLALPMSTAPATPDPASVAVLTSPAAAASKMPGAADPNGSTQPVEAPVYPTRLAPPATLHYALRRGAASGKAVLRWSPDGDRYELSLRALLSATPNIARASHGSIDAHGIAPERYVESRRERELRAVNFRRDSARITFSGPQVEYPLPAGAQDRLSWMLQLGAVLSADPSLEAAGQAVLLFVVGSRGDAEVWTFNVHGRQLIDLPNSSNAPSGPNGATVETVLLRREPRHLYDTMVEVWLDPARHHLPVRAHLTVRGESTQFVLDQLDLP